jgi:hypothetical protein
MSLMCDYESWFAAQHRVALSVRIIAIATGEPRAGSPAGRRRPTASESKFRTHRQVRRPPLSASGRSTSRSAGYSAFDGSDQASRKTATA